jgi:phosphotriesterase-related protein
MDDVELHSKIAAAGAFVGYDRVGLTQFQPDSVRVRLITEMLERGHGRQLIISTDLATQKDMRNHGRPGYSYLIEEFLPRLREAGVDEPAISMLTVENPRRLLCGT